VDPISSIRLDYPIVPIENIEHNLKAIGLFRYFSNTRRQRPHTLSREIVVGRTGLPRKRRALETKDSNRRKVRSLPVEGRPPQSVFEISVGFRIDLGAVAAL
jgi:hypothetical protein